ncbi:MAG: hypothetical protein K2W97_03080 [Chthoniobacterales bacterium]|nr:hypothetical protein [Chthoniobacterales bacterium]
MLYESDEATNKLWNEVKKRYEESKMTNLEGMEFIDEEETKGMKEAFQEHLNSLPFNQDYPQAIKGEALKAVREKIPGAYEILLQRYLDANKKAGENSQLVSFAEATKKALHCFQEEEKRLSDIEVLWIGIIDAKNRNLLYSQIT